MGRTARFYQFSSGTQAFRLRFLLVTVLVPREQVFLGSEIFVRSSAEASDAVVAIQAFCRSGDREASWAGEGGSCGARFRRLYLCFVCVMFTMADQGVSEARGLKVGIEKVVWQVLGDGVTWDQGIFAYMYQPMATSLI